MKEPEMVQIADLIARTLRNREDEQEITAVRAEVAELCKQLPVYGS